MSTSLKRTFEERATAEPWQAVDQLVALGRARVRRRRRRRGAAAVATAVVVSLGVSGLVVSRDKVTPAPAETPVLGRGVSWAQGSVVHVGERSIDVGETVAAYVVTDRAVVTVGEDGVVRTSDLDGTEAVGLTSPPARGGRLMLPLGRLLVAADDAGGSYAAWYDAESEAVVVYDTRRGDVVLSIPSAGLDPDEPRPAVLDIDGRILWVADGGAASARDLTSGAVVDTIELDPRFASFEFGGASAGRVLVDTGGTGYQVLEADGTAVRSFAVGPGASVSPGGDYVVGLVPPGSSAPREAVFEVASGQEVTPRVDYPRFAVDQWLDDDTVQVAGLGEVGSGVLDLLTCDVPTGSCELVADVDGPVTVVPPGGGDGGYEFAG